MSTMRRTRAMEQTRFEESRRRDDERNDLIRKVQADRVSDIDDHIQVFGRECSCVVFYLGNEVTQADQRTSLVFWPLCAYDAYIHQFWE